MSAYLHSGGKSSGNRRLDRSRAFQVVYSLFFSPVASARDLGRRYSGTIYSEPQQRQQAPFAADACDFCETAATDSAKQDFIALASDAGQYENAYEQTGLPDLRELRDSDVDPEVITPGQDLPFPTEGFAWELVLGVWQNQAELDKIITRFSQNWKLARMGRVELALLRLAAYELLFRDDVPPKVIINEAIELSKLFGDDSSRNFVNGILDAAVKAVESGQFQRGSSFWGS